MIYKKLFSHGHNLGCRFVEIFMEPEELSGTKPLEREIPGNVSINFAGWERVGYFGSYLLYARGNIRRIVDPNTGKIVAQYILKT